MADTTNYEWTKPTVGGDDGTWGTILNTALDDIDTSLYALDQAVVKLAGTQTVTGDKTFSGVTIVPNASADTHALNRITGDGRYVLSSTGIVPVLRTETVLSSSTANVEFTSNFTSTDRKHIFQLIGVNPTVTSDEFILELSSNGGSTYAVSARYGLQIFDGTTTTADAINSSSSTTIQLAREVNDGGADGTLSGEIEMYQYRADSYVTNFSWRLVYQAAGSFGSRMCVAVGAAQVAGATAVNAVRFSMSGGNMDLGAFRHLTVAGS